MKASLREIVHVWWLFGCELFVSTCVLWMLSPGELLAITFIPHPPPKSGDQMFSQHGSSRPALDLTLQQEQDILDADNGDWDSEFVVHWCLGASCPVCKGDERQAKRNVCCAVKLSLCRSCVVPLEYRWKGMDQASAGAYRGCKQHRLLPRALARVFDSAKVRKAEENMVAAAARGEETDAGSKRLAKGGQVTQYFSKEVNMDAVDGCMVANKPLQHFMNAAFAAEAATTLYCNLLHATPGVLFLVTWEARIG